MFCDFRQVQPESRFKMRLRDAAALRKLEDLETKNSKPLWILIKDWDGALDHMAPQRPTGAGQIIRRPVAR